jgi:hypothetical protein
MSEDRIAEIRKAHEADCFIDELSSFDAEAAHGHRSELLAVVDSLTTRLSQALRERDELSADLLKLREATRVRPSKKAMAVVRETLEAMEAMDEEDAAALRLLVEMYDKLEG